MNFMASRASGKYCSYCEERGGMADAAFNAVAKERADAAGIAGIDALRRLPPRVRMVLHGAGAHANVYVAVLPMAAKKRRDGWRIVDKGMRA